MIKQELKQEIRRLLEQQGSVVVAVEGHCAAGKTTLAQELSAEFGARIFHADDYFLRPEQRTAQRLEEIGGNFDRERFAEEVAGAAQTRQNAFCRKYFCSSGTLSEPFEVEFTPVTVIEGSYCMHPALGEYYDLGVFVDISPEEQSRRIMQRNGRELHKRFVEEWIPMENRYFKAMGIPDKCRFII